MKVALFLLTILILTVPQTIFAEGPNETPGAHMDGKGAGKEARMQARQDLHTTLQDDREAFHAAMQQRKADFKAKLQTLKDEKKKMHAEKLDTRLSTINKDRTDNMTANITRLNEILTKLKARKESDQTAGKDVTAVTAAISAADQAIAAAQAAVAAQASKDYTAQVTDDSTLKQNFGQVISQMKTDLAVTHKTVVDAKQAVRLVATSLHKIEGGEMHLSPTP